MRDQYKLKVPNDLVVMDLKPKELAALSDTDRQDLEKTDWFEPRENRGIILVSASDVQFAVTLETEPEDAGVNLDDGVDTIDSVLKRYNKKDGFYHA